MNLSRLERLIVVLERVHALRRHFDMERWTTACGTASCALGWAAVDPVLKRQGLHLEGFPTRRLPVFEDCYEARAGGRFFDISLDCAIYLFYPNSYELPPHRRTIRPRDVIRHIREVIANDGRPPGEEA